MNLKLSQRKAIIDDLPEILHLLFDDELGSKREKISDTVPLNYLRAFEKIDGDSNQYLMVVLVDNQMIGTCHLTLMPSLTYQGSTRMQIEAVRVAKAFRGQRIGEWMMRQAFDYAKQHDVGMVQLSTNKERPEAKRFYEKIGFHASHEGMKYFLD